MGDSTRQVGSCGLGSRRSTTPTTCGYPGTCAGACPSTRRPTSSLRSSPSHGDASSRCRPRRGPPLALWRRAAQRRRLSPFLAATPPAPRPPCARGAASRVVSQQPRSFTRSRRRGGCRAATGDREVLQLVFWDDLTHAEAAAVLGCSVNAVELRFRRAQARVRDALVISR